MTRINSTIQRQTVTDLIASAEETYNSINAEAAFAAHGTPITELNFATNALVTKNNTYAATLQLAGEQLTERDEQRKIVEDLLFWSALPAPTPNCSQENIGERAYAMTPFLAEILSHSAAVPHGGIND